MADLTDNDLAVLVRKALVKSWIDVSKVRIRVAKGVAILSGRIDKIYGATDGEIDPKFLSVVDHELQTIKGLRRIRYQFENWTKDGGEWVVPLG